MAAQGRGEFCFNYFKTVSYSKHLRSGSSFFPSIADSFPRIREAELLESGIRESCRFNITNEKQQQWSCSHSSNHLNTNRPRLFFRNWATVCYSAETSSALQSINPSRVEDCWFAYSFRGFVPSTKRLCASIFFLFQHSFHHLEMKRDV